MYLKTPPSHPSFFPEAIPFYHSPKPRTFLIFCFSFNVSPCKEQVINVLFFHLFLSSFFRHSVTCTSTQRRGWLNYIEICKDLTHFFFFSFFFCIALQSTILLWVSTAAPKHCPALPLTLLFHSIFLLHLSVQALDVIHLFPLNLQLV